MTAPIISASPVRAQADGSFSFYADAPANETFALVTPEGERRWDPDFHPRYFTKEMAAAGTVFDTTEDGKYHVWLLDSIDSQRHRIRYVAIMPGHVLTTIEVAVTPVSDRRSSVTVGYHRVSLSAGDDASVRSFTGHLQHLRIEWAQAFAKVLGATSRAGL